MAKYAINRLLITVWFCLETILYEIDRCESLSNVTLSANPAAVQRGKHVSLSCQYDLEGAPLYSVKWYRGRHEFYRFSPSELPPTKVFPIPGINVDVSKSNASQVVLREVGFNLSGNISCEVTADAPGFSTAVAMKHLMVVDLPKSGPVIVANKMKYDLGDRLLANCSSPPSKPHATLYFYVNKNPIMQQETKVLPGPDSLLWSSLSVDLTLLPSHFDDSPGVLSLKCAAVISPLYSNTTELSLPYRREPTHERVTSQTEPSSGCNDDALFNPAFIILSIMTSLLANRFFNK